MAIVPYPSNEAASDALAGFTRHGSTKGSVSNIGSEARQWGTTNSIAFRRGHINVFIESRVELNLLSVENSDLQSLNKGEKAATSKLVACFVDLVILDAFESPRIPESGSLCFQDLMRKGFINPDYLRRF